MMYSGFDGGEEGVHAVYSVKAISIFDEVREVLVGAISGAQVVAGCSPAATWVTVGDELNGRHSLVVLLVVVYSEVKNSSSAPADVAERPGSRSVSAELREKCREHTVQ
eukprot:7053029-Pyramimonas_sp.AAC.1